MKIKDVEKLIEDCADYYPREVDFVPYTEIERRAKGHEINSGGLRARKKRGY